MCPPEHFLSRTFIPLFSYFLYIHIYLIFAIFSLTKMNQNRLWSQEYLTVRYFWEDRDMFCTKIGTYFWQETVCDCSYNNFRNGSRTTATSKMDFLLTLVNCLKPSSNFTKNSILDASGVLDMPPYLKNQVARGVQVFCKYAANLQENTHAEVRFQ